MTRALRCIAVIALATLVACGASKDDVTVVFAGSNLATRFGEPSAKQKKAYEQLNALVGHTVKIDVADALASRWSPDPYEHIETAILAAARELGEVKRNNAERFGLVAERLEKISYEYSAIALHSEAKFDPKRGVLRVLVADSDFCGCHNIGEAFRNYESGATAAKYAGREPKDIPEAELDAYLDTLQSPDFREHDVAAQTTYFRRYTTVFERTVGRRPTGPVEDLHGRTERILLGIVSDLVSQHMRGGATEQERTVGTWVNAHADEFSVVNQRTLLMTIGSASSEEVLPTFDRAAFTVRAFDRWLKMGAPTNVFDVPQDPSRYAEYALCPRDDSNESQGCDTPLLDWFQAHESKITELFAAMLTRKNPVASAAVFRSFASNSRQVILWRRFEPDDAQWQAVGNVVAKRLLGQFDGELYEDLARHWRSSPQRRPMVMFTLGRMNVYRGNSLELRLHGLAKFATATPGDVSEFLGRGIQAFEGLDSVWPLLGQFPRAPIILQRLGAVLDKEGTVRGLEGVVQRLCSERRADEVREIGAAIKRRFPTHPKEEVMLHAAVDAMAGEKCGP